MKKSFLTKTWDVLQYVFIYFLSLVLIAFAFSKFFDNQFQVYKYSGHISLKDLPRMTHAWSFFGRSYSYNLFLGIIEFAAGALIVFKRTRLIGLLLALGLFANILIIDIEFQVKDALTHVIVETIMVILLLIPYLPSLKAFFWNMAGKIQSESQITVSKFARIAPIAFLALLCIGFLVEAYLFAQSKEKFMGEYTVQRMVVANDTLPLSGGKNTKQPMLFFEFGNVCILSADDSTFWGDYFIRKDSIEIVLDKQFRGVKSIKAGLNRSQALIQGITDQQQPIQVQLATMPKRRR